MYVSFRMWRLNKIFKTLYSFLARWSPSQDGRVEGSSPVRTPKLQLAVEQPSTWECWIPPKNNSPYPRQRRSPNKMVRSSEIMFRIKPQTSQRCSEGTNKTLYTPVPRGPHRDWYRSALEYLNISCWGMGQQWPDMGTGTLVSGDRGHAAYGINSLGEGRN